MREVHYTFKLRTPKKNVKFEEAIKDFLQEALEDISFIEPAPAFDLQLDEEVKS